MNHRFNAANATLSGPVFSLFVGAILLAMVAIGGAVGWFLLAKSGDPPIREPKQAGQDVVDSVGDGLAEALERAAQERLAQANGGATTAAWRLRCGDSNDTSTCTMNQELFLQRTVDGQQQTVGRLLNLTVVYLDAGGERVPFLSLQMPLGVDLRPGAVMRVDDEAETALEFLRCTESGCDASARVTPDLLAQMRAGNVLRVGFRPWGSEQVTAVDASLIGFTAAFEQLR